MLDEWWSASSNSSYRRFFLYLQNSKYKVLNRDQWCNVLEFSRSILPDLSNYDEDGACKYWLVILPACDR